jgi:hypothetical protein
VGVVTSGGGDAAAVRAGAVDALLDDPAFFAPFAQFFHLVLGRAVDAGGVLPAADVLEVPSPAGI